MPFRAFRRVEPWSFLERTLGGLLAKFSSALLGIFSHSGLSGSLWRRLNSLWLALGVLVILRDILVEKLT